MSQKEIEEFKEWLSQVKLSFTEAISSLIIDQTVDSSEQYLCVEKWLNLFAAPTSGLEHHYRATKKGLAESIDNLKLPDSDKSNILCCFNAWLAFEWNPDKKLFSLSNHNLKELEAIIAASQDSGYAVKEQNTYEYKLLNGEQSGRFWWWEAKGKWVADSGWVERLIQQVLASPELQIRLPESPINETYMNDDLEDCLSRHKISQQEAKESLNQLKADLVAFLGKRLQELPGSKPITSAGPIAPWDDSTLSSTRSEANSQEQKKWWEFWKR